MDARRRFDTTILLLAIVLTCFGVVMVYSSSSIMAAKEFGDGFHYLKRQGGFALVGFLLMTFFMFFDYRKLRRLSVPAMLCCIALLVLVLVPGVGTHAGGATRWIRVAGFNIQPAELAKLGLILFMAHSLAKKKDRIKTLKFGFLPYMILLVILLGLLLLQPDMGSAVTIAAVAMVMLMVAGTRWQHLLSVFLIAMPFVYFLIMNVDYRRRRILAFLNPWEDPNNSGWQIIQSFIAFGSGGVMGNGLGKGKQKLFFLPEAHTDFIFSVVGEEIGFVGVLVVSAIFLVIILRGFRASLMAPDDFGRYLAFGITVLIGLEAFVNMAVVMGMLPTKGLALPLLSYGGTSLVSTLIAVGILLNVSSHSEGDL